MIHTVYVNNVAKSLIQTAVLLINVIFGMVFIFSDLVAKKHRIYVIPMRTLVYFGKLM